MITWAASIGALCWLSDETSGIMIRALCDNSTLHSHRLLAIPSRGHLSTLGCEDEQKERVNSALRRHFQRRVHELNIPVSAVCAVSLLP